MHIIIEGMHCSACVDKINTSLAGIQGVTKVSIDLPTKTASVHGKINEEELLNAVKSTGYSATILNDEHRQLNQADTHATRSDLSRLIPLFFALGLISIIAWFINDPGNSIDSYMVNFMGVYFLIFGASKIIDLKNFPKSFGMYDPIATKFNFYGWVYPFIEITLGLMFISQVYISLAVWLTIVVLSITTIGVVKILMSNKEIECACLGTWMKLPMTKATFIENFIMLFMAFWILPKL